MTDSRHVLAGTPFRGDQRRGAISGLGSNTERESLPRLDVTSFMQGERSIQIVVSANAGKRTIAPRDMICHQLKEAAATDSPHAKQAAARIRPTRPIVYVTIRADAKCRCPAKPW